MFHSVALLLSLALTGGLAGCGNESSDQHPGPIPFSVREDGAIALGTGRGPRDFFHFTPPSEIDDAADDGDARDDLDASESGSTSNEDGANDGGAIGEDGEPPLDETAVGALGLDGGGRDADANDARADDAGPGDAAQDVAVDRPVPNDASSDIATGTGDAQSDVAPDAKDSEPDAASDAPVD